MSSPSIAVLLALLAASGASGQRFTGPEKVLHGGPPLTIVRDGRPLATIVVQSPSLDDPSSADHRAARLLQEWIELMTGARLPIADWPGDGPSIYVGEAAIGSGLDMSNIRSPSHEGVRIVVGGEHILMSGQTGASRIKVATLLLEELGCRWFMEGELGKEYPRVKTLSVPQMTITDQPGLIARRIGGSRWSGMTDWKVWNGAGGMDFRMGHDWRVVTEGDFDEHPEWFALDANESRVRGPWLNTGNPELREVFAERLIARMEEGDHPSISPPDGFWIDHSPESVRLDDPEAIEETSNRVSMSNRFMDFANDIARRVGDVYPDSCLSFYAYSNYTEPPTRIDELEPNLCIWIAPILFSRFHRIGSPNSPSRQRLAQIIDDWAAIAQRFGYRTYNYNLAESMTPYSKLATWRHDIPYLAERGAIGINVESFATWDLNLPTLYLSIRLAYHPYADADVILDDLFASFYGAAAEPMREYWLRIDDAWQDLPTESGSIYSLHLVWTAERLDALDRLLAAAERRVHGDARRQARVAMARLGYRHAVDFTEVRRALNEGNVRTAQRIYDRWLARTRESIAAGTGHPYNETYLRRFVGRIVGAAHEAIEPAAGPPARLVRVLPDQMKLGYERDLQSHGVEGPYQAVDLDDSGWAVVQTYSNTLDQQGYPDRMEVMWYRARIETPAGELGQSKRFLFFTRVDGEANVWVNGHPVGRQVPIRPDEPAFIRGFPALEPFEVDITEVWVERVNTVAIRVDHTQLQELSLGGIVGPIFLIERPGAGSGP